MHLQNPRSIKFHDKKEHRAPGLEKGRQTPMITIGTWSRTSFSEGYNLRCIYTRVALEKVESHDVKRHSLEDRVLARTCSVQKNMHATMHALPGLVHTYVRSIVLTEKQCCSLVLTSTRNERGGKKKLFFFRADFFPCSPFCCPTLLLETLCDGAWIRGKTS